MAASQAKPHYEYSYLTSLDLSACPKKLPCSLRIADYPIPRELLQDLTKTTPWYHYPRRSFLHDYEGRYMSTAQDGFNESPRLQQDRAARPRELS